MALHLIALQIRALDGRDIRGGGHELDYCIDQLLYTLVPVGAAAADRNSSTIAGRPAQDCLELLLGRLLAFEEFLSQVVIQLTDLFDKLCPVELCLFHDFIRNRADRNIIALVVIIDISFHLEQVNEPAEGLLSPDRDLDHDRVFAQTIPDLFDTAEIIRADHVHFIDERHARDIIGVRLTPYVL